MDVENTPSEGLSSMEEAVAALQNSRVEQSEPETATEEPEAETEELTDDLQPDEIEAEEIPDDEAEAGENSDEDADEDADTEADDEEETLYEVEGETFTLSELQAWKKGGLRQEDYTRKTQEIAKERETLVAEREAFTQEREQTFAQFQQQQAQLQDALATFAIEQHQKPKRSEFRTVDEYLDAQEKYAANEERKQQASQMYQAMQAEQMQSVRNREIRKAMEIFPEWTTDEGFQTAVSKMTKVASEYGFTQEEVINGGTTDHRTFRVLDELARLRELVGERDQRRKVAAKKVTKATKRLTPGSPNSENASKTEVRKARESLKKTRSTADAVALLQAKRKG